MVKVEELEFGMKIVLILKKQKKNNFLKFEVILSVPGLLTDAALTDGHFDRRQF
jgi:hypothetical protein